LKILQSESRIFSAAPVYLIMMCIVHKEDNIVISKEEDHIGTIDMHPFISLKAFRKVLVVVQVCTVKNLINLLQKFIEFFSSQLIKLFPEEQAVSGFSHFALFLSFLSNFLVSSSERKVFASLLLILSKYSALTSSYNFSLAVSLKKPGIE